MVSHCANPLCGKPLHYLRDGRVYLFNDRMFTTGGEAHARPVHLTHYWLCGVCSLTMTMVQDAQAIRILPRRQRRFSSDDPEEAVPRQAP
jgi:hypothetical protein